jgi:hypothetical protein
MTLELASEAAVSGKRDVSHRLTGDASAIRPVLRIARYRFRATLGHCWGGYLAVVLLVGLVGGVAMASIAAARRTQSSFSVFLASTNPSDLSVPTFGDSASGSYSATLTTKIARLREVKHVEAWISVNAAPLRPDGAPILDHLAQIYTAASVDGLYFNQDRMAVRVRR